MQPIPVGVDAVLQVVLVYFKSVVSSEGAGVFPGGDFQLHELNIMFVIGVPEQGMAKLVQKGPHTVASVFFSLFIRNMLAPGMPRKMGAFYE